MSSGAIPSRVVLQSGTASGTDAVDTLYVVNASGHTLRVLSASIVPVVSVSTHAANYITTTLKDGAGGSTIGSHTTNSSGGTALTAGTPRAITISGTGLNLEIADGAVVEVDVAKAGTGPAYEFTVAVVCEPVRA